MSEASNLIEISYMVYPGDSARWFPRIMSVIQVKPDKYEEWKNDMSGKIKLEDVLADPKVPVRFLDSDGKRFITNPSPGEVYQWYQSNDPMEIASKTFQKGRKTDYIKRMESEQ